MPLVFSAIAALALASTPARSSEIETPGPAGPLRGTLLEAGANAPVVLIIPGSGPTDRDGNSPLGIKAAMYRLIAEGLATRSITSLRIDKRGMFGSAAAVADPNAVTVADYGSDTHSWIKALRARTGAGCVWLLGHSEGGLVALAAAQQSAGICGLILAAAPGRPLGTILRDQLRSNPANAPVLGQAMAAISALEAGTRVDTANMHPALMPLFAPQVQGAMISLFSQDPVKLLASYKGPVLILQGERDIQVTKEDAAALAATNSRAKLALIPEANHVLKAVASSERAANIATYADPALPLAPGVIDAIAGFILPKR